MAQRLHCGGWCRIVKVLVIKPGSAGEARHSSNGRQLSCAVLDTATEEVVVINFLEVQSFVR